MRAAVRATEALQAALLVAGLGWPLGFFLAKVEPWKLNLLELLARPPVRSALLNSVCLAVLTSVASTGCAFLFSWALWRYRWPGRAARVLELTLKIPYLLPPFFFAIGWIALAAPGVGYLSAIAPSVYGFGGTLFVLTLWCAALAMIQLQAFFAQYPGSLEDAAILCGASPARAFLRITMPLAAPRLVATGLITAVHALAAFGVPAMLGTPAREHVLTTRIYQGIKSGQDFSEVGALSLVLLAITGILIGLQWAVLKRSGFSGALVTGKAAPPASLRPGAGAGALFAAAATFALVACVLPCAAVVLQSFLRDPADPSSLTLSRYTEVFGASGDALRALGNSLRASALAAGGATVLGLLLAAGSVRLLRGTSSALVEACSAGYALPGTVLALSLLAAYSGSLTDTISILALAYFVKYAALAPKTLAPALAAISREHEEAAWMAGASPARAFVRIIIPMLRPALAAALFLAFVPMLSELTMSVFLAGAGTETLGALIYRLQEYADPGSASVLAVTIGAATLAANAALRRISRGSFGL